jgi:hypothetical protein
MVNVGTLYQRAGASLQAREHLATATAVYRDFGMSYWLTDVEALSI